MNLKIKRIIDFFFSLTFLIFLSPFFLIISVLIITTSRGPVLFTQDRPGYHGKIFKIYKFRTMKLGSEKMINGVEVFNDDNRITKIGKFLRRLKIDELPQLINIIKGEMSLVGPRPERIDSMQFYDDEISKRLNMRPGLTGLAQINGNIYLKLDERYKFDIEYIEKFSLKLDLKIILKTFLVVFFGENRYVK